MLCPTPTRNHEKCHYCGLEDKAVEAGGIWYCPNDRCKGPGGGASRHLQSCRQCVVKHEGGKVELIEPCAEFEQKHAEKST